MIFIIDRFEKKTVYLLLRRKEVMQMSEKKEGVYHGDGKDEQAARDAKAEKSTAKKPEAKTK